VSCTGQPSSSELHGTACRLSRRPGLTDCRRVHRRHAVPAGFLTSAKSVSTDDQSRMSDCHGRSLSRCSTCGIPIATWRFWQTHPSPGSLSDRLAVPCRAHRNRNNSLTCVFTMCCALTNIFGTHIASLVDSEESALTDRTIRQSADSTICTTSGPSAARSFTTSGSTERAR